MKQNKQHFFRLFTLIIFIGGCYSQICGQSSSLRNFFRYDDAKRLHFGIALGVNHSSNLFEINHNENLRDTIFGGSVVSRSGFQLGMVNDLRLFEYMNLRSVVSVVFWDRAIQYYMYNHKGVMIPKEVNVESIYLVLPLALKVRAKRWREFRPYLTAGIEYAFDLSSLKKVKPLQANEVFLRMNNHDFLYRFGVGFDFYLPYFKFAVELTSAVSLSNVLVHDKTIYTRYFDSMKSNIFCLSFTFE